jgi:endonuclease YncB( thermonuclease family)
MIYYSITKFFMAAFRQGLNEREKVPRKATVVKVDDAATFIIRPNMAVKLAGVQAPPRGTEEAREAKTELERLLLRKKVEFDTREWDRLGRSIAHVKVDGKDVNKMMAEFLENLKSEGS